MRTSAEWWAETKSDPAKLSKWLAEQYHGEATASNRIQQYMGQFEAGERWLNTLNAICTQEAQHAEWIADLMRARGLKPQVLDKTERYWEQTLPSIDSFEYGAAVAAHAEEMRLERIRAIASDESCDVDIRTTFRNILKDEVFHAKAFTAMAGNMKQAAAKQHAKGLEALGLII